MCARSIHNSRAEINGKKRRRRRRIQEKICAHRVKLNIERTKTTTTTTNASKSDTHKASGEEEKIRSNEHILCILSYNSPIKRDQIEPYPPNHFQYERQSNLLTFNFWFRFISWVLCLHFGTFSFDSVFAFRYISTRAFKLVFSHSLRFLLSLKTRKDSPKSHP